jgi:hypothetical protein
MAKVIVDKTFTTIYIYIVEPIRGVVDKGYLR